MRPFLTEYTSVNYGFMPWEMCTCFNTEEIASNYFLSHIKMISEQSHILIGLSKKYILYKETERSLSLPLLPLAVLFPWHTDEAARLGDVKLSFLCIWSSHVFLPSSVPLFHCLLRSSGSNYLILLACR